MRIVRLSVLLVLVGLMGAAGAQATGCKATIYFRGGNSVKIDHFGTTTKVYTYNFLGTLGGQSVHFNLCDLGQIDFTEPSKPYSYVNPALYGTAVITNRQGKRFTMTGARLDGVLVYTYQDPVTGKVTSTQADIKNNVASITIGAGTGGAHEGQMKKDPATGEFFPGTYLYDPYTGAELIWANPQQ